MPEVTTTVAPHIEVPVAGDGRGGGATTLPALDQDLSTPQVRRRVGGASSDEILNVVGAAVTGLCTALLLFGRIAPFSGPFGMALVAYVTFLLAYALLVWLKDDGPAVTDKIMTALLCSAAAIMGSAVVLVISFTLWRGRIALTHTNLVTEDMGRAGPLDPVSVGGIKHAIIGTLIMISIALVLTVPLGLACAVYLNETTSRLSRFVRTIVDAMTALPSIVAGLFVYATWILTLGFQKSGFAAAMAVSVMMLPIIVRASDVVLRLVPGQLREASYALGAPKWRTVRYVVMPTARSGLATSVILGMARGLGETSPVLLTAGFTNLLNTNPTSGPMVSLPLAAYEFVRSPQPALIARGFATAAVLLLVVLFLFIVARILGGHGPGHVSKNQARRSFVQSGRDLARFEALAAGRHADSSAPQGDL